MNARDAIISTASYAALLAIVSLTINDPAAAQEKTGTINSHFSLADKSMEGQPAMVSAIRGGQVIDQAETKLPFDRRLYQNLDQGVYDVRVEGDDMVTEVKRGVHVFAGRELDLQFKMRPGKGVHTVEYATGGLSREEIAARLQKLDEAVAELQKAQQSKQ